MPNRVCGAVALGAVLVLAAAPSAHAFSTGFVGNCAACHSGGANVIPQLTADNPCLTTSQATTIHVVGANPNGTGGGFDLSILGGAGTLTVGGPDAISTRVTGADITQSATKPASGGQERFSAIFVAPSMATTATLQVYYLAANNNGTTTGDGTGQANLNLMIAAPPTCGQQNCGQVANMCGQSVSCGVCTAPQTCGGAGVSGVCGCTPAANACAGKNCGSVPDGCGGAVSCGACTAGFACVSSVCVQSSPAVPSGGRLTLSLLAAVLLISATVRLSRKRRHD